MEAVDALVAAPEPSRTPQVALYHDADDVIRCEPVRMPVDLHVPEAVRRVPRLERVVRTAGGDHAVGLGNAPLIVGKVGERHISSPVDDLSVHQRELCAARAQVAQSDPAVDVLSEVDDLSLAA